MSPGHATTAPRVVVVGGGVAALEATLALRRLAPELAIVIVNPRREFVYRPLAVAEPLGLGRAHRFDFESLAASAGAELVAAKVTEVAAGERRVLTDDGGSLDYDALLVAVGARPRSALPGAITYWGMAGNADLAGLLTQLERGEVDRVAFAVHAGTRWQLPLYELALLTGSRLRRAGVAGPRLVLVTHEGQPLALLGAPASARVRNLLAQRDIDLLTDRHPTAVLDGALEVAPPGSVTADRVVTLPRLEGPRLAGLPADEAGFIPVDALGRVRGAADVYAAGSVTSFAVKEDGIAAQQAYSVATAIAASLGLAVDPEPFRPMLRGLLNAEETPLLRAHAEARIDGVEKDGREALWWPGAAAGRHLAPHLAGIAGATVEPTAPASSSNMAIEVELASEAA